MVIFEAAKLKRGLFWVAIAIVGGFLLSMSSGSAVFIEAWIASILRAASGAYMGYWISRDLLHIDPSNGQSSEEVVKLKMGRAICVGSLAIAVCAG